MTTRAYRDDIQGLRAIAVLGVLIFHANKSWLPGGFTGVDIFFVISGFLMSSIILRQKEAGNFSVTKFYLSRIRRIVPAYVLMLLAVTTVAIFLFLPEIEFKEFKKSLTQSLFFNSAQYFGTAGDYFAPESWQQPLQHTWTLAVEMQFYLILPFILWLIPSRWAKILVPVLAVGLLAWSEYALRVLDMRQSTYFSLPARMPEFLLGTLVAQFGIGNSWSNRTSQVAGIAGLALIAAGFVIITEETPFPGLWSLIPCVGTALIIAARHGIVSRLMALKLIVFIGALSYSIYLWHWPVFAFLRVYFGAYQLPSIILAASLVGIMLVSWISYVLIENPFRKVSTRRFSLLLVPILVGMGVLAFLARDLNKSVTESVTGVAFSQAYKIARSCDSEADPFCPYGDALSTELPLLLIGDSHAGHLAPFFHTVGENHHFPVQILQKSFCRSWVMLLGSNAESDLSNACGHGDEIAPERLRNAPIVIVSHRWSTLHRYTNSHDVIAITEALINVLAEKNQKLILIGQIPELTARPRSRYKLESAQQSFFSTKIQTREEVDIINQRLSELAEKYDNVFYLDVNSSPVFQDIPYYDGILAYFDDNHINMHGSLALAKESEDALLGVLKQAGYPPAMEIVPEPRQALPEEQHGEGATP